MLSGSHIICHQQITLLHYLTFVFSVQLFNMQNKASMLSGSHIICHQQITLLHYLTIALRCLHIIAIKGYPMHSKRIALLRFSVP